MWSLVRLLVFSSFFLIGCNSQPHMWINDLIESLERLLDFLILDIDHVDADCLMGIVLAEAQLNMMLDLQQNSKIMETIQILRDKCNYILNIVKPKVPIHSEEYRTFVDVLLAPEIWETPKRFVRGELINLRPYVFRNGMEDLIKFIFDGMPNETLSDICLSDVIKKSTRHCCRPKRSCLNIMLDLKASHGYPLTHKLLYFQVGRAVSCFPNIGKLQNRIQFLCSRILAESRSIENLNVTIQRDLYLEQMVLCGVEGYQEFLEDKARRHLLDWQSKQGCYSDTNYEGAQPHHRQKRMSVKMLHGCSSHYSGLAAAALALNIRYLLVGYPPCTSL